ncbi:MAG: glycoside hydrolase family 9 protein [Verrucomicrobiota bacterium]|nr:glycoside hydrolase family 9 protein [Verrucomicrobiota bacterium]
MKFASVRGFRIRQINQILIWLWLIAAGFSGRCPAADDGMSLALPVPGEHALRILSPTILELSLITQSPPPPGQPERWNFFDPEHGLHLPAADGFKVTVDGRGAVIRAIGFKRRPVYAPLKQRDLRLGNYLYVQLAEAVKNNQTVEVANPDGTLWSAEMRFTAKAAPLRFSPVIHVNQVGYLATGPKQAMVGFYLGSLGELDVPAQAGFEIISVGDETVVYRGRLVARRDQGFPYPWYQYVEEADFSGFRKPGEYRLAVPGLGASYPFFIDEKIAGAFARTFALGLYHQRCGTANALPYTRFTHAACHTAPAEVPTAQFKATQDFLKELAAESPKNPRQTAPPLQSVDASLYPFVRHGKVDVSGGHHDAGDYSKYTVNSASLIHYLVFAADAFPGVAELDNLGLPESGDGKSDLLEEAKWEADFLIKMQDDDGGFYFLVYPRDRKYENDVLPDHGDPQVVWPKTTTATAAAVAALAECGSSPAFKRQFPKEAARYLKAALRGWKFLSDAIARHGKDGAYQQLTHDGDEFMHDDELAWAAAELFAATGDSAFEDRLRAWLDPRDPETRRWGWWRMSASYGRAIRSYAFAVRTGRLKQKQLNPFFLKLCEDEIAACAEDWLRAAQQSAYGTSFPEQTKRVLSAGWYFSLDQAFDLVVASQLDFPPQNDLRPQFREAILSNLNYAAGCNPVNICFIAGLGWHRPREVVHNYAQNDRRALPPTGLQIGNIQDGFGWMDQYKRELGNDCFPLDGDKAGPYPMYDRWGDSFNLETEATTLNEGRALAVTAWLMAQTPLRTESWHPLSAEIVGLPKIATVDHSITVNLKTPHVDLQTARIVWEARDQEPVFGRKFTFSPRTAGPQWIEVEAQWPDGRRAFGVADFTATAQ